MVEPDLLLNGPLESRPIQSPVIRSKGTVHVVYGVGEQEELAEVGDTGCLDTVLLEGLWDSLTPHIEEVGLAGVVQDSPTVRLAVAVEGT